MDTNHKNPIRPANATSEQAVDFLQLCRRSVMDYQKAGLLKPVYFGRRRFFRWSDLERLAKNWCAPWITQPAASTSRSPSKLANWSGQGAASASCWELRSKRS
jgi:hypothetical protein